MNKIDYLKKRIINCKCNKKCSKCIKDNNELAIRTNERYVVYKEINKLLGFKK